MSVLTIATDAAELLGRVVETREAVEDALSEGTYTTRDLRYLQASIAGERTDLRALRRRLDGTDVTLSLAVQTGERIIALWAWERGLRNALLPVEAGLRDTAAAARELERGRALKTYVVRAGDTLQGIAARFLGDWREWTRLLEANGLGGTAIIPGMVLTIPEKT